MFTSDDAPPAPSIDPALHSTFALQQLTAQARKLECMPFVIMASAAFAREPSKGLVKLYEALRQDDVANPVHTVTEHGGFLARYDRQTQSIEVERLAIEAALSDPAHTSPLLIAMIQAFGLYIDDVLLAPWTDQATAPPASLEEADQYRQSVMFFDDSVVDGAVFGHYSSPELSAPLVLALTDPSAYFNVQEQAEALPTPERFSAGRGDGTPHSFAHQSIEDVLGEIGFGDDDRLAIYFGNWLRDYSQLLDPKIVRPLDAPKNFPYKLSRAALTQVVDLLALKHFHVLQSTPQARAIYQVTESMVGVYRPSEHIDNPLVPAGTDDPQQVDADFEPLVQTDDPRMTLDAERSLYLYIDDAAHYMREKLLEAMQAGRTPAGMRSFGEALHVLEDFFAHSNFVELSLRKAGYASVLPWTTEKPCRHRYPLVTGLFAGSDIVASVAEPIAAILFPTDGLAFTPTQPGERSDTEQMLLILLEEHEDPTWKNTLVSFLNGRDHLAEKSYFQLLQRGSWLMSMPLRIVARACNHVMNAIVTWAGDSVDDVQTLFGNDPNTDATAFATHSQLAKDHDTHPLHGLAALLARQAVNEVGRAMYDYWAGNHERDPVTLAASFIRHAEDSDWQHEWVAEWAKEHADEISTSSSSNALRALHEQEREQARERLSKLGVNDNYRPVSDLETINSLFPFG